jgi:hypothetical protein
MADTYNTNDIDPITGAQQAQYQVNGINYISDNDDIIPRDAAGNIILTESGSNNPLLIINPVAEQITTTSIIRALDTAFQYYKFPVSIIATTSSVNLDLDLNIDLAIDTDPIYARYKPSQNYEIDPDAIDPDRATITGTLMDQVVEGVSQSNTNKYTITKEIKNSGANLRFRVKMHHVFLNRIYAGIGISGGARFSVIKVGPNTPLNTEYKIFTSPSSRIEFGEFRDTELDLIIANDSFELGDKFSIGMGVQQTGHVVDADQTYWVITDASKNVDDWNQEI